MRHEVGAAAAATTALGAEGVPLEGVEVSLSHSKVYAADCNACTEEKKAGVSFPSDAFQILLTDSVCVHTRIPTFFPLHAPH